VVPKVGGTTPVGAVRNSRGAVKQKWAIGGGEAEMSGRGR